MSYWNQENENVIQNYLSESVISVFFCFKQTGIKHST